MYRKREQARRGQEHGVFARFRYIDLKEAARGCGGRGPLWELNGVEWCCEGMPGLCGRARQTAPGAWKVAAAKKCREQSVWGSRERRFVWRQVHCWPKACLPGGSLPSSVAPNTFPTRKPFALSCDRLSP